jgi:hypothetical protein
VGGTLLLEGGQDLRVESPPPFPQQAPIDDLMGERVLERQRTLGKVASLVEELCRLQMQ